MSNLLKNKLSISALQERANSIASEELLSSITGGIQSACHPQPLPIERPTVPCDNI